MTHDQDEADKNAAIEKVRKLLATARSKTANENEAAIAMKMVQAIVARLNLDLGKIEAGRIEGTSFETDSELATTSQPWRRQIAAETARLYLCDYFFGYIKQATHTRKCGYVRLDQHSFVGKVHNIVVAKEMFVYFVDTIEEMAKSVPSAKRARMSFCNAAAFHLCQRIRDRYFESKAPQEHGLIGMTQLPALYEDTEAALAAFMDKEHSGTSLVEQDLSRIVDQQAARDGYRAGGKIGLDTQITEAAKPFALPKGGA